MLAVSVQASAVEAKSHVDCTFAIVLPGGAWCLVGDLQQTTIDAAPKLSHREVLAVLVKNMNLL